MFVQLLDDHFGLPLCEGVDNYDHRPFPTTNEQNQAETYRVLKDAPVTGNVMVGTSGFFLLNAFAARESERIQNVIIIDRSLRTEHFWTQVTRIILSTDDRFQAAAKIKSLIERESIRYFSGHGYAEKMTPKVASLVNRKLQEEIDLGTSWLSQDDRYQKVQRLFSEKRFFFLRLDFTQPEVFTELKGELARREWRVDILYISNVWECVKSEGEKKQFLVNMEELIGPDTYVIQVQPRCCDECMPAVQRVVKSVAVRELFPDIPKREACSALRG